MNTLQKSVLAALLLASSVALTAPRSTLTFWHYFADRTDLFQALATEYEAQTGVAVKLELLPGDVLGQKFQAAAQANTLPDISASWTGIGDALAPYAKAGQIMNLQTAMDAGWKNSFVKAQLESVSFATKNTWGVKPGVYLVPLDSVNMQIFYNKTLFAKAGITQLPRSYDELLAVSQRLRKAGIEPFISGFGSWGIPAFGQPYMWNMIGKATIERTYLGQARYDSAPWVNYLGLFKRMADANMLATGGITLDFPAAESMFGNGQVAMLYDGSWGIGVLKNIAPQFKDYGVFAPPPMDGARYPLYINGGVGATLFINGQSPRAKDALAFVKWITEPSQQARYATSSLNLPANRLVAGKVTMTENLTSFAQEMDRLPPALKAGMKAAVETTMIAGVQRLLQRQSSPAEVAALMQKAQETDKPQ